MSDGARPDDAGDWLAAAFAPGALGDAFQPVRELGRGGMGVVVLVRERALHRTVAVKFLRPSLAGSPRAVDRFAREARIQAQLEHPGVVPLHATGAVTVGALGAEGGGPPARLPYLVMRYVAGASLARTLDARAAAGAGPLAADVTRRFLGELADVLAFAHGRGVVHRDLKPENVLLEQTAPPGDALGRALLTDFGVAALPSHDDPRTADHAAGTPRYMAPEQLAGEHAVDGRTDVYALGAIGLALLTGRRPYADHATAAVAAAHLAAPVPDVAALAPDAPRDLCRAVARCLAKDPAARWPTAAAFGAALGAQLGDGGAARPSLWARLRAGRRGG